MTRFSRLLRRFVQHVARPAAGRPAREAAAPSPALGKTVLIVRLNGWAYAPLARQLEQSGYGAQVVNGGPAALNALVTLLPAVLVVVGPADVPLYGALRRATPVPILVLATHADEETTLSAFAAGVDQFQAMPVSCDEAMARVLALLRRGRAANDGAALSLADSCGAC
jgi:DNA-binding response OmpR family regulator